MKSITRIYIVDDENEKVFGEGPYRLLKAVEQAGSLRAAASCMGMAYTKALRILRRAEQAFGQPITSRSIGGSNGGGSVLTPFGMQLLDRYERFRCACDEANHALFAKYFGNE